MSIYVLIEGMNFLVQLKNPLLLLKFLLHESRLELLNYLTLIELIDLVVDFNGSLGFEVLNILSKFG